MEVKDLICFISSLDLHKCSPDSTALTSLSVASELNNGQRKNCANLKFQTNIEHIIYVYT